MKTQIVLAAVLLTNSVAFGQTSIDAKEVVTKINQGQAVSYQNATITGDIDLTHLNNQTFKLQGDGKWQDTIFTNTVTVPVIFMNCTFTGKVIGYFNPDNGKEVWTKPGRIYNTNFENDLAFKSCTFEQEVNFKYSQFKGSVNFSRSQFRDLTFFKYSDFAIAPDFSQAQFKALSFKYVKFPKATNFEGAKFNGDTDFKYAEFSEGANFQKAIFEGFANFKYAKFSNPNVQDAVFNSTDFKYTTVNSQKMPLTALTGKQ